MLKQQTSETASAVSVPFVKPALRSPPDFGIMKPASHQEERIK
jgi:hypothetical protein